MGGVSTILGLSTTAWIGIALFTIIATVILIYRSDKSDEDEVGRATEESELPQESQAKRENAFVSFVEYQLLGRLVQVLEKVLFR